MQEMGLEPTRYCYHRHLKPARLPIPPLLRTNDILSNVGGNVNYFFLRFPQKRAFCLHFVCRSRLTKPQGYRRANYARLIPAVLQHTLCKQKVLFCRNPEKTVAYLKSRPQSYTKKLAFYITYCSWSFIFMCLMLIDLEFQ